MTGDTGDQFCNTPAVSQLSNAALFDVPVHPDLLP